MSSLATIHREMVEHWNKRDFDGLRTLFHAEYTHTGGDGQEASGGPDTGVRMSRMWANAFPDGKLEIKRVYTQENTSIAEMIGRGTHTGELEGIPATGKQVQVVVCNVLELRDGKIYREREYLDKASILSQIGVLKPAGRTARA
jgi:steroid delta-isomerase-like uncharacterized protein